MYLLALALHSIVRWVVVLLGLRAAGRALAGSFSGRAWTPGDTAAARHFVAALDLQFLIGLLLYFVFSPLTRAALGDMGEAMRDPTLRFWAVEHTSMMLGAVILAHAGAAMSKRGADRSRYRKAASCFTLAMVLILVATPWPFSAQVRPWLRLPW